MTDPMASANLNATAALAGPKSAAGPWRLCVAPMMDWTDRHCRFFHRLLAPSARLYTEMLHAQAVLHGQREQLLGFDGREHPLALQLGGSEPSLLAAAARIGVDRGYDEINLNCGCPSDRVQAGRFGACLMREPALVGDCVAAMRAAVAVPVTVKCRIGVDQQDPYADLHRFVATVRAAGCSVFIVHARKAWLSGLSPKENRDVPPLNYARVFSLRQEFPDLTLVLNGGLDRVDSVRAALTEVDGVMLGRAAYHDPWLLAELQQVLFGAGSPDRRNSALLGMREYIERHLAAGGQLAQVTRHVLGLHQGRPGARQFRRILSERAHRAGAGWEVVERAMAAVEAERHAA